MGNSRNLKDTTSAGEDENALFQRLMADAKPLKGNKSKQNTVKKKVSEIPKASKNPPLKIENTPLNADIKSLLEAGIPKNLDRKTMDRLRKGKLRPEKYIDLHGMTTSKAYLSLNTFLSESYSLGYRCVLVITGKGSLKRGGGVIRRELPSWLNSKENRKLVLGFSNAQPIDGGTGAFYILLKRQRTNR